VKGKVKVQSEC